MIILLSKKILGEKLIVIKDGAMNLKIIYLKKKILTENTLKIIMDTIQIKRVGEMKIEILIITI